MTTKHSAKSNPQTGPVQSRKVTALVLVFEAVVFGLDTLTPLGFAHGMLYVPLIFIAVLANSARIVVLATLAATALAIIGIPFSADPVTPESVYLSNRAISILVILGSGVVALMMLRTLSEHWRHKRQLSSVEEDIRIKNELIAIASKVGQLGGWALNLEEQRLYWTEEVYRIHGMTPGESEPDLENAIDFYAPEDRPRIALLVDECIRQSTPYDEELTIITAQGQRTPVRVSGRAITNDAGQITSIQGAIQDISYFRQLHSKAERQEQFANLADAMPIVIWMADAQGAVDFANQALCDYTGLTLEQLDLPKGWLTVLHPDDQEATLAQWRQCVSSGHPYQTEFRIRRADGHYGFFLVRATRIEHSGAMRWYGSATNMDDYHQLQAQLAHTQKMEAIGQLTGGMAHDFNNVLTAVLGSADLLKETLGQQPELASLVDTIILAAEKGATLNRSLLAFARRQALDPVTTDITALICGMEAILRRTLPQRIDFQVALPEHALFARIDPAQLESTLLNLALNARDAMPAGGRLLVKAGLANEGPEETGRWVNIRFQDTGSGIAEDKINHIFEPFFTTKGEGQGSGLGLSMAFGFIKQSGGHINVQSKVNQGTTFDLYLPADEIPRTQQAPA